MNQPPSRLGSGAQAGRAPSRLSTGPSQRVNEQENTQAMCKHIQDLRFDPLKPDLFDKQAEAAARIVGNGKGDTNKSAQLRKFYDELSMWNDKVQWVQPSSDREAKYQELAPFIKMLKAKVAYAKGRKHVDEAFQILFAHCIDQVKDARTLAHCKLFFEAFMGFYKAIKG